jgi:hypothetical protein
MRRNTNDDKALSRLNASWRLTEKSSKLDCSDLFSKSESDIATFHKDSTFQELLATLRTNTFCGNFEPFTSNILLRDDEWVRLPKRQKKKESHIDPIFSSSDASLDGSLQSTVPCIVETCPKSQSDSAREISVNESMRNFTISREMSELSLANESINISKSG